MEDCVAEALIPILGAEYVCRVLRGTGHRDHTQHDGTAAESISATLRRSRLTQLEQTGVMANLKGEGELRICASAIGLRAGPFLRLAPGGEISRHKRSGP
jgi:hypothetical protein